MITITIVLRLNLTRLPNFPNEESNYANEELGKLYVFVKIRFRMETALFEGGRGAESACR